MLIRIMDENIENLRHQVHFRSYMYVFYREMKAKHDIFCATMHTPRAAFLKIFDCHAHTRSLLIKLCYINKNKQNNHQCRNNSKNI